MEEDTRRHARATVTMVPEAGPSFHSQGPSTSTSSSHLINFSHGFSPQQHHHHPSSPPASPPRRRQHSSSISESLAGRPPDHYTADQSQDLESSVLRAYPPQSKTRKFTPPQPRLVVPPSPPESFIASGPRQYRSASTTTSATVRTMPVQPEEEEEPVPVMTALKGKLNKALGINRASAHRRQLSDVDRSPASLATTQSPQSAPNSAGTQFSANFSTAHTSIISGYNAGPPVVQQASENTQPPPAPKYLSHYTYPEDYKFREEPSQYSLGRMSDVQPRNPGLSGNANRAVMLAGGEVRVEIKRPLGEVGHGNIQNMTSQSGLFAARDFGASGSPIVRDFGASSSSAVGGTQVQGHMDSENRRENSEVGPVVWSVRPQPQDFGSQLLPPIPYARSLSYDGLNDNGGNVSKTSEDYINETVSFFETLGMGADESVRKGTMSALEYDSSSHEISSMAAALPSSSVLGGDDSFRPGGARNINMPDESYIGSANMDVTQTSSGVLAADDSFRPSAPLNGSMLDESSYQLPTAGPALASESVLSEGNSFISGNGQNTSMLDESSVNLPNQHSRSSSALGLQSSSRRPTIKSRTNSRSSSVPPVTGLRPGFMRSQTGASMDTTSSSMALEEVEEIVRRMSVDLGKRLSNMSSSGGSLNSGREGGIGAGMAVVVTADGEGGINDLRGALLSISDEDDEEDHTESSYGGSNVRDKGKGKKVPGRGGKSQTSHSESEAAYGSGSVNAAGPSVHKGVGILGAGYEEQVLVHPGDERYNFVYRLRSSSPHNKPLLVPFYNDSQPASFPYRNALISSIPQKNSSYRVPSNPKMIEKLKEAPFISTPHTPYSGEMPPPVVEEGFPRVAPGAGLVKPSREELRPSSRGRPETKASAEPIRSISQNIPTEGNEKPLAVLTSDGAADPTNTEEPESPSNVTRHSSQFFSEESAPDADNSVVIVNDSIVETPNDDSEKSEDKSEIIESQNFVSAEDMVSVDDSFIIVNCPVLEAAEDHKDTTKESGLEHNDNPPPKDPIAHEQSGGEINGYELQTFTKSHGQNLSASNDIHEHQPLVDAETSIARNNTETNTNIVNPAGSECLTENDPGQIQVTTSSRVSGALGNFRTTVTRASVVGSSLIEESRAVLRTNAQALGDVTVRATSFVQNISPSVRDMLRRMPVEELETEKNFKAKQKKLFSTPPTMFPPGKYHEHQKSKVLTDKTKVKKLSRYDLHQLKLQEKYSKRLLYFCMALFPLCILMAAGMMNGAIRWLSNEKVLEVRQRERKIALIYGWVCFALCCVVAGVGVYWGVTGTGPAWLYEDF
ncbi:hypothetical protein DFH27DRAFT_612077 [Peziza echinospora]|nr:hypothetical protein DFH27DRAFT_612077 [Peziza echinospora]